MKADILGPLTVTETITLNPYEMLWLFGFQRLLLLAAIDALNACAAINQTASGTATIVPEQPDCFKVTK